MTEAVRALDAAVRLGAPVRAVFSHVADQFNIYIGDVYIGGVEFRGPPTWLYLGQFIGQNDLAGVTRPMPVPDKYCNSVEDVLAAGFIKLLGVLTAQPDPGTMV